MSDKISGISSIYNYNNSSGGSSNFYQKHNKESNFKEILDEQLELPSGLPRVRKGLTDYGAPKNLNIKIEEFPYPIKYACVPVYYIKYDKDDKIIGYMASKCFVTGYKEDYLDTGEVVKSYEVVYPYSSLVITYEEMNVPKFENKKCINSYKTDMVFDNYKNAKDECLKMNQKINVDSVTLSLIDTYEELVFQRTKNFEVTKENKQTINYPKNTK